MQMAKKRKNAYENGFDESPKDFIHSLPDDILISIISRLAVEEAVRTSVLSRRWKYLWTYFTGCLDFTPSPPNNYLKSGDPVVGKAWFVAWVNSVLNAHRGETVQELRLSSIMNGPFHEVDLDGWMRFAREKHVQKLSLYWCYNFPKISGNLNFNSLRFLSLTGVDGGGMEHVLSTCPLLEGLKLEHIHPFNETFRVSGSSLMLKFLTLKYCSSLKQLEVSAPNLTELKCIWSARCVVLLETPKLVKLSLSSPCIGDYRVHHDVVPSMVLQIETFNILLSSRLSLTSLKRLMLEISADSLHVLSCISVINLLPRLREFTVELTRDPWTGYEESPIDKPEITKMVTEEVGNARHRKLEAVKVHGFLGSKVDTDLILGLAYYAVSLEKVTISLNLRDLERLVLPQRATIRSWATVQIQRLKSNLPPGIQLETLNLRLVDILSRWSEWHLA